MDLILRSVERMLQTQLSMARRFKLQVLRRYNVKFSKMRNFMLETLRLAQAQAGGEPNPMDLQPMTLPLRHRYTCNESRILNKYKYFLPHLTDLRNFPRQLIQSGGKCFMSYAA